jgi:ABC-2 type transport system ATP-binding protein
LIGATAGAVTIRGEVLTRSSAAHLRGRIGFLTEAPGLWDRLTVGQNLLVYARLQGLPAANTAVTRALELFDIRDRERDTTAQLSKGLKQRVALARTLLHDPQIVLLDEPTSGLDPESAREVRRLILRMQDEGRAVLVSTHNLDEVSRIATRVAVLRTSLLALDTPAALRARLFGHRVRITVVGDATAYVRVARDAGVADVAADGSVLSVDPGHARTPDIVSRLVSAGAEIEAVVPEEPPLEDVYLKLLHQPGAQA